jgi:hypothetical protein
VRSVDGDLAHRQPALADAGAGGAVTLGLRPDAFVWPAPTGMPRIEVTAAGVEALRHESHVLFTPPDGMPAFDPVDPRGEVAPLWSVKIRERCDLRVGDSVVFGVDLTGAHFFDTTFGVSLRPATGDLLANPVPALTS